MIGPLSSFAEFSMLVSVVQYDCALAGSFTTHVLVEIQENPTQAVIQDILCSPDESLKPLFAVKHRREPKVEFDH